MISVSLLVRVLLVLLALGGAQAQTVINSVPYAITASGKYVLGANLVGATGSEKLVTINAPNVILDLNGFFLSGPAGNTGASTISAIYVNNVSNVTVRNGTVANMSFGIFFDGFNNLNHLVENVNVTRCTGAGVMFQNPSPGSIVRNNTLSQIGGATGLPNASATGVLTAGGVRVEGNSIATVAATGGGFSFGISASTNANAGDFIIGNTVSNCQIGIYGGKYLNNLTSGCSTPFLNGTNATGNN